MVSCQSEDELLCHKLTAKVLDSTLHFNKMDVANACTLFSRNVSSALKFLVEHENRDVAYLSVAHFIDLISLWFEYCACRNPVMALSMKNKAKYDEAISFLKKVIEVFSSLKIGNGVWKPVQTGLILATTSLVELAQECLHLRGFIFFLTGRVNQDCVENLFSVVRLKKPVPTPLDFERALKQIVISQFLHVPKTSNYHMDDSEYFTDLFSVNAQQCSDEVETVDPCTVVDVDADDDDVFALDETELSVVEENALYHLSGYCVHSILKTQKLCDVCVAAVLRTDTEVQIPDTLLKLREYKAGSLIQVSKDVFSMLSTFECMFRQKISDLCTKSNVKSSLIDLSNQPLSSVSLPTCHNVKAKLISKYIDVRLRIYASQKSKEKQSKSEKCTLSSKSVAMRALVSQVKS